MKWYIIKWDTGFGESYNVVQAESEEEADELAYEGWRDEIEGQANYWSAPFTREEAEGLGLEDEWLEATGEVLYPDSA